MKRTVQVVITKQYEIEIADELLTPEEVAAFSDMMWPVSSEDELFTYAAEQLAQYDSSYIEGIGKVSRYTVPSQDDVVSFELIYDDVAAEII